MKGGIASSDVATGIAKALLETGKSYKEIAEITGTSKNWVHRAAHPDDSNYASVMSQSLDSLCMYLDLKVVPTCQDKQTVWQLFDLLTETWPDWKQRVLRAVLEELIRAPDGPQTEESDIDGSAI